MIVENIIFSISLPCNTQNPLIVYSYVMSSQLLILFSINKVVRNKMEARVVGNLMRMKWLVLPLVVGINISCCKSKVVVMPLSLTPRIITKHKQYAYGVQLAGSWQRSSGVQCVARVDNYCALLCSAPL